MTSHRIPHLSLALPNTPLAECLMASPPGVPLAEAAFPGVAVPHDGGTASQSSPAACTSAIVPFVDRVRIVVPILLLRQRVTGSSEQVGEALASMESDALACLKADTIQDGLGRIDRRR